MSKRGDAWESLMRTRNPAVIAAENAKKKEQEEVEAAPFLCEEIPRSWASAVWRWRGGVHDWGDLQEMRTRYGTERYFMESFEELYKQNGWECDAKTKRAARALFRGE